MKEAGSIKNIQGGFTLIEMLLYMGLLTMLLLLFTNIFTAILDTQLAAQSTSSVSQDGRFVYSRITYDIHRASRIDTPIQLGDVTNTLQLTIGGVPYVYTLENGNLLLSISSSSAQVNSVDTAISDLQFKRIGNINGKHTVQINFTVANKINLHGSGDSKTFQTTAGLR